MKDVVQEFEVEVYFREETILHTMFGIPQTFKSGDIIDGILRIINGVEILTVEVQGENSPFYLNAMGDFADVVVVGGGYIDN